MWLKDIYDAILGLQPECYEVQDAKFLAASTDYAAEDVLSGSATINSLFEFSPMSKKDGRTGTITDAVSFCSVTALIPRITLYLFNKIPTTNMLDNVANTAPSTDDLPYYQKRIDFQAWEDLGGGSCAIATEGTYGNLPLKYKCITKKIYGIAVTRDAITGESAGMKLAFKLWVRFD